MTNTMQPKIPDGPKSTWSRQADTIASRDFASVAGILPELVAWLRDMNWPGAGTIAKYLVKIGGPVVPHVREVLRSNDAMWQYWVLEGVVAHWPLDSVVEVAPELRRLANQQDPEGVHSLAAEILDKHELPLIRASQQP